MTGRLSPASNAITTLPPASAVYPVFEPRIPGILETTAFVFAASCVWPYSMSRVRSATASASSSIYITIASGGVTTSVATVDAHTNVTTAVDAIIRLVLSHVMQPAKTPADAAADIAWVAGHVLHDVARSDH